MYGITYQDDYLYDDGWDYTPLPFDDLPEHGEEITYYPPSIFRWQKWVIICVIIPLLALGVFLA